MGALAVLLERGPRAADIFSDVGLTAAEGAVWPIVDAEAAAARVDPALVMAVIAHESNFKIRAVNPLEPKGGPSRGLMQVQLATGQAALRDPALTPERLMDPATNVRAGSRYLADQLRRYGGDVATALAAYNAGTAYRQADGSFVNQAYVDDVLRRLPRYQAALAAAPSYAAPIGAAMPDWASAAWPLLAGGGVFAAAALARARRGTSGRRRR